MESRLKESGNADMDIQLCCGIPKAEILNRAKLGQAGLVVMATHGRGFVREMFLGSVSHTVARHAEAPVLLVPLAAHENE